MNFIATTINTARKVGSIMTAPVRVPASIAVGKVMMKMTYKTSPGLEALVLKLEEELGAKKGGAYEIRGLYRIKWDALGIDPMAVKMMANLPDSSFAGRDGYYIARNPLEAMHELGHVACRHAEKRAAKYINGEDVNGVDIRVDELEANAWAISKLKEAGLWEEHGADMTKLAALNWLSYNVMPSGMTSLGFMGRITEALSGEAVKWTTYERLSLKLGGAALRAGKSRGLKIDASIMKVMEVLLASTN